MNFILQYALLLFLICQVTLNTHAGVPEDQKRKDNLLSVKGQSFFMNDQPFDMWGIRVASASQSEELTDHLIAQLDDYYAYGVNTIDIFIQGSSGGFSDPFLKNGKKIKNDHLRRVKRIIEACNDRGMVVIVGVFYQRAMADLEGVRNISNAEGVKNAVQTVAKELKGYGNIILNIANEQNSAFYKKCEFYNFNDPENIIALCKASKLVAPDMLVGGGGYHDESNIVIGNSPAVDILLFDTFYEDVENEQHSQWHYDLFTSKGITEKPIVNVEMFGGWTKKFMPPGVYPEEGKQKHLKDIDEAAQTPGLFVHFHSNPWCQGPSIGEKTRYDLGGMGTEKEPGIRWWFEYVKKNKSQVTYEAGDTEYRSEVSQYGITWTFDKPAKTGKFITGDWWVQGPVTIVKVTPAPGPVPKEDLDLQVNRWNDTSLKEDTTLRNGSMIVHKVGNKQSYDSRAAGFSEEDMIEFPLVLHPDLSLISSISNSTLPVENFAKNIMWDNEKKSETVMKAAAVLTCVKEVPPKDAFRPPYVGTSKPFFQAEDIIWDLLPKLSPAGEVPSWEEFERYFQRPWIDHLMSWSQQQLVPNENGPNYGREHARIISIASLMVSLDVPQERKKKLTIGLIQRGIDLYGLALVGGYWNEGGGHSSGRKWPILFASIMLDEPQIRQLPETAFFQEDTQTYYGEGWFGQTALWQMIQHHGKRTTYEEKPPEEWEKWDKISESYRTCCNAVAWVGTALTARYMKAIKIWNHDAYFDYVDRWMREDDPLEGARGEHPRPESETTTFDPFVTAMWNAHRKNAPEQEMAANPRKWIWEGDKGAWVPNSKPKTAD